MAAVALIEGVVAPVLQRYVPTPTALRLTDDVAHVNVALDGEILTVGGVLFWNTSIDALAVQPLAAVNVTEYIPVDVTLITGVVAVVFHRYVPVPTALRLTLGLAQVNVALDGLILTEVAF